MAGSLQPLDEKFAIVDAQGKPTLYFIKWAQQKQIDITDSITLGDLQAFLTEHALQEGLGIALTPDGDLNNSPSIAIRNGVGLDFDAMHNLKLADTAAVPGTYGDATHVAQITVDQQGRITGVTPVAISGGGGGKTTLGANPLGPTQTPSVNFQIMTMLVADDAFTISKIAFVTPSATPTAKFQPFVYASAAGAAGALLGSGPQITGALAGYNEAPLSAPIALTKGAFVFVGISVITAAILMYSFPGGTSAFLANGGTSVPLASNAGFTKFTTVNGIYPMWAVA